MILGITLARGGSKGLPRKNIKMCAGKPLIVWTIERALESALLDRYFVSTDDTEIAAVSQEHKALVIPRPERLSGGNINRWDVLKFHLLQFPEASAVVLLQPTSPIRHKGLIDDCIREFLDGGYDSLATGFWHHDSPYPENRGTNRQEMTPRFFDDGNIYIWRSELIRDCPKQEAGEKPCLRVAQKWESIDINDEIDLWLTERILGESSFCSAK